MQDTVGDQDVSGDDAGAVHEDFAVDDGDGDVAAAEGGDGAIGQRAAVGDGAVNDVVLQDGSSLLGSEVAQGRADVLKRSVVGSEDGQVGCGVDSFGEVGGVDSTQESTQTSFLGDHADVRGNGEEAIDDMDHTTVECDVLEQIISFVSNPKFVVSMTYSFSDSDVVLESRDSKNLIVLDADFDDLTASDIGEGSVVEESRREGWSLGDAG